MGVEIKCTRCCHVEAVEPLLSRNYFIGLAVKSNVDLPLVPTSCCFILNN